VKSAVWLVGVGLMLVAASCDPDLSREQALEGKRCGPVGLECVNGYVCQEGICVAPDPPQTGAGGTTAPGAGGTNMTDAGGTAVTDAGGAGGSEAIGDGMDTMSSDVPDAADATPDCTAELLFRDLDGDGFGSGEAVTTCPADGWVSKGQDCLDDPADSLAAKVHPEQPDFFAEGYSRPDQPGVISFDYDCSGDEVGDPDNRAAASDECNTESSLCSTFAAAVPPLTPRSGASINALCGSTRVLVCNSVNSQCISQFFELPDQPFRCH